MYVCVDIDTDTDIWMRTKSFGSWGFLLLGVGESKLLKIFCDQAYIYH